MFGLSISEVSAFWGGINNENPLVRNSQSVLPIKNEFFHGVSSFPSEAFEEFKLE